jgi:serine/threonine-protein kinase
MAGDPEKIGRYQVIERVGRGGMGVLYRGMDPVLDREVAIKLMLLDFSEDEEQMRPRFYREARAVAKLQHRNIVTVFEFAEEGTTPYIVMEFLRGTPLSSRMKSPLPLPVDTKLDIVAQLCMALDYAHRQGVVHRDVKPANVFVLSDGTVKLLDFGIAKVSTSTLTRQGDVLGSASYMSPEQVAGADAVDGRADIFSVGVVLYELLAGRRPFQADAPTGIIVKILHEAPPPITDFVQGLPPALVAAVNKALAKNPAERFATAGDMAAELQRIRRTLDASDGAEGMDETRFASSAEIASFTKDAAVAGEATSAGAQAPPPKKSWVVPAAIAALLVVGVGGYMMTRSSGATPSDTSSTAPGPSTSSTASAPAPSRNAGAGAPASPAAGPSNAPGAASSAPATSTTDKKGRPAASNAGNEATGVARKTASASTVTVAIASTYPVAVTDASGKTISAAAESHNLNLSPGTTIRITSADYFLDQPLKIEDKGLDFQAPALGYLTVLTKYETCKVKIGAKDLGFPPITKLPVVSGQHRVDIACPNGENPLGQIVVVAPNATATARIY